MLHPSGVREHDQLGVSMLIERKRVVNKAELQRNLIGWKLSEQARKQRAATKRQTTTLGQLCPKLAALQQRMEGVGVKTINH